MYTPGPCCCCVNEPATRGKPGLHRHYERSRETTPCGGGDDGGLRRQNAGLGGYLMIVEGMEGVFLLAVAAGNSRLEEFVVCGGGSSKDSASIAYLLRKEAVVVEEEGEEGEEEEEKEVMK